MGNETAGQSGLKNLNLPYAMEFKPIVTRFSSEIRTSPARSAFVACGAIFVASQAAKAVKIALPVAGDYLRRLLAYERAAIRQLRADLVLQTELGVDLAAEVRAVRLQLATQVAETVERDTQIVALTATISTATDRQERSAATIKDLRAEVRELKAACDIVEKSLEDARTGCRNLETKLKAKAATPTVANVASSSKRPPIPLTEVLERAQTGGLLASDFKGWSPQPSAELGQVIRLIWKRVQFQSRGDGKGNTPPAAQSEILKRFQSACSLKLVPDVMPPLSSRDMGWIKAVTADPKRFAATVAARKAGKSARPVAGPPPPIGAAWKAPGVKDSLVKQAYWEADDGLGTREVLVTKIKEAAEARSHQLDMDRLRGSTLDEVIFMAHRYNVEPPLDPFDDLEDLFGPVSWGESKGKEVPRMFPLPPPPTPRECTASLEEIQERNLEVQVLQVATPPDIICRHGHVNCFDLHQDRS